MTLYHTSAHTSSSGFGVYGLKQAGLGIKSFISLDIQGQTCLYSSYRPYLVKTLGSREGLAHREGMSQP